jgi:hypothetical protein
MPVVLVAIACAALTGCGGSGGGGGSGGAKAPSATSSAYPSGAVVSTASAGAAPNVPTAAAVKPPSAAPNGEASKSPAQILADASAALRSAGDFEMRGSLTEGGQAMQMSVAVSSSKSADVSITMRGGTFEVIVTPSAGSYGLGSAQFWASHTADPRVASLLAGRWVKIPAAQAGSMTALLGPLAPDTIASCMTQDHGTLSLGGTTTVAGVPAILIRDAGDLPGTQPGTLAVATTGPAYPLQVTGTGTERPGGPKNMCNEYGKGGSGDGEFTISRFGQVAPIQPPANALQLPGSATNG